MDETSQRGEDPGVERGVEFEHDDINYPEASGRTISTPMTLGALFQSHQQNDPMDSPDTPFAFVGSPGRQPFYCPNSSISGRTQKSNDSPTTPTTPSPLGSPAWRSSYSRSQSLNGRIMKLNDPTANVTTPLAIGSPGRTSPYARSQSMNGKIQKPNVGRSWPFSGKYGKRNHHLDSLQKQLYNTMRALGMDHQTIVERLEKLERLKEQYANHGEQPRPDSPLSGSRPSLPVEDNPAQESTIALLQHKFAQLERLKESSQSQQIPLYPNQNYHGEQSPSRQRSALPSSCPSSPRVAPDNDLSYEFDDTAVALIALQQELMWSSAGRSTASGACDVSISNESVGLRSPKSWHCAGGESPSSSICGPSRAEEPGSNAINHKLQPPVAGRHSSLGAFQDASFREAAAGHSRSGESAPDTLVSLFEAETMASVASTKVARKRTELQTKLASSLEMAMAKLSFSLIPKLSLPKCKAHAGSWGTGLSLSPPVLTEHPGRASCGSDLPDALRNHSRSCNNEVECPDSCMEHEEFVDTALRL